MATIEINGKVVEARDGAMLIEAAAEAGFAIPHFCYHRKLTIAASCRMCLVEVEKAPKPLPACATPVSDGMKVQTRSPKALAAQKAVMEFLLINHPLDCPICDQGGECDLQELAVGYGGDVTRFAEGKRVVGDPDLGPLIATEMTRCIHCTRCVRFIAEIAGTRELGAPGRGEHMHITSWLGGQVGSELSGNVIDLCPVGALTSKPFRFRARAWELNARPAVAMHDGLGANLWFDTLRGQVLRARPRDNEAVNECWLSDRDRFACAGLHSDDRLRQPLLRDRNGWREAGWDEALPRAAQLLRNIVDNRGGEQLAALAAPSQSAEEYYLLQKLLRALGSPHIEHRLRQGCFTAQEAMPLMPGLGMAPEALQAGDAFLMVGCHLRKEQPLLNHRVRQAVLNGAAAMAINPVVWPSNYPLAAEQTVAPSRLAGALAEVAQALAGGEAGGEAAAMAERLRDAEQPLILVGAVAQMGEYLGAILAQAMQVAEACGGRVAFLPEGGNSAAAWLAGAVPHRGVAGSHAPTVGKHLRQLYAEPVAGLLLLGIEPERDSLDPAAMARLLEAAEGVVALAAYDSPLLREHADVILPLATWAESAGTQINHAGLWQSYRGAVAAPGEARPGWKVLRVLGNLLDLDGFDFNAADEVLAELRAAVDRQGAFAPTPWPAVALPDAPASVEAVAALSPYSVDAMVRRSPPLQAASDAPQPCCRVNPALAERLGRPQRVRVGDGAASAVLALEIDERVADGCIVVPTAIAETALLGAPTGAISVEQAA